jgi:hypothetical protein
MTRKSPKLILGCEDHLSESSGSEFGDLAGISNVSGRKVMPRLSSLDAEQSDDVDT